MNTQTDKKPLDRYRVIQTHDVEEMTAAAQPFYGELHFSVPYDHKNFKAQGNHCQLNDIGISYVSFRTAVDQAYYAGVSTHYAVPLVMVGEGWGETRGKKVGIDVKRGLIAPPGERTSLHTAPNLEEIALLLDASAVARKLTGLIGAELKGDIVFDPALNLETPAGRQLWRLLCFLIGEAETRETDFPFIALNELEQALIVTFLKASSHNFSDALNTRRDIAPQTVRLVEEYIEAHWDQPITVEELALLTNVSVRSLFYSFKKSRGYSPMGFVKQVRLRHAREMLLRAPPGSTVAEIASRCGFCNLGNFAMDYRRAFDERPSSTLKLR